MSSRFLTFLLAILSIALLSLSPVDACSKRRNNRFPGIVIGRVPVPPSFRNPPTPVFIVNPPTFSPTPQKTSAPTAFPTFNPTAEPTPVPTPPPPPVSQTGFQPTPDRGTVVEMMRPRCVKSSTFERQEGGGSSDAAIKEKWTYTCSFNVYVTVDLGTINMPTPCACGVKLDNPAPASQVNTGNQTTTVDYVRLVVFDEVQKKVVGEIPQFKFQPNENTTKSLQGLVDSGDYSPVIAGFAGVAEAFPNKPALLDQSLPNQQSNVPALCFQVTQQYVTDYQWPEPKIPRMAETPNLFMTDCIPYSAENPNNYKRDTLAGKQSAVIFFREFLVFAKENGVGYSARNRYITSFYLTNLCKNDRDGVVSFDRQFEQGHISKPRDGASSGVFRWTRKYTDMFVIAGVPKSFSQVTNYLTDGFYAIEWTQTYTLEGDGKVNPQYVPGLLRAALLGDNTFTACNGMCKNTKLCTQLPADWTGVKMTDRKDNANAADLYVFPTFSDTSVMNCQPAFTKCAEDGTWLAFQNFGGASRDFNKIKGSHLFTGPRSGFCSVVESVLLDTLEFKPIQLGNVIRKRNGENFQTSSGSTLGAPGKLGSTVTRIAGTTHATVNADPTPDQIPAASELLIRPGTGSADADMRPGGDHPVTLFPEAYVAPMSVRSDDSSCQTSAGTNLDDYCIAGLQASRPPCLPGQRGCSCRAPTNVGSKCDLGLECVSDFCIRSSCPAGNPGCLCDNGGCVANRGLSCDASSNRCVFSASVPRGSAGQFCDEQSQCSGSAVCQSGFCLVAGGAAGVAGGACKDDATCADASYKCDSDLGMCLTQSTCSLGAAGCDCAAGSMCSSGFTCTNKKCVAYQCTPGTIGCPCLAGDNCEGGKLKCQAVSRDGSKLCVGVVNCKNSQKERCIAFCGEGNVRSCPSCDYQVPVCQESSASGIASSVAMVAIAVVLALFL